MMDQMSCQNHQSISTRNSYCLENREQFNLFQVPPSLLGPANGSVEEYEFRLFYTTQFLASFSSEQQLELLEVCKEAIKESEKNHIKK